MILLGLLVFSTFYSCQVFLLLSWFFSNFLGSGQDVSTIKSYMMKMVGFINLHAPLGGDVFPWVWPCDASDLCWGRLCHVQVIGDSLFWPCDLDLILRWRPISMSLVMSCMTFALKLILQCSGNFFEWCCMIFNYS